MSKACVRVSRLPERVERGGGGKEEMEEGLWGVGGEGRGESDADITAR